MTSTALCSTSNDTVCLSTTKVLEGNKDDSTLLNSFSQEKIMTTRANRPKESLRFMYLTLGFDLNKNLYKHLQSRPAQ